MYDLSLMFKTYERECLICQTKLIKNNWQVWTIYKTKAKLSVLSILP